MSAFVSQMVNLKSDNGTRREVRAAAKGLQRPKCCRFGEHESQCEVLLRLTATQGLLGVVLHFISNMLKK